MNPSRNLFLIGPMGAGKTSIGRRLAHRLELPFVDLDQAIETYCGAPIATIFDLEGEAGFRRRETEALSECSERPGVVLATGGGAVLAEANRRLLSARGYVLFLDADVERQLERLARDRARPLLRAPDRRARLETLAAERGPLYRASADLIVDSRREGVGAATARIADLLAQHWRRDVASAA